MKIVLVMLKRIAIDFRRDNNYIDDEFVCRKVSYACSISSFCITMMTHSIYMSSTFSWIGSFQQPIASV